MQSVFSKIAATGCLALTLPLSCVSNTPSPVAPDSETASAPVDKSKPIGPRAVNAGQCVANMLIDDLEANVGHNIAVESRGGYWYTYKDEVGTTVTPDGSFAASEGGANGSKFSARMNGTLAGAQVVYAGMGVSFTQPKEPYDASCCTGISFQGKKTGSGTANVRFKVGDWQTSPEGGLCKECYNDFGASLVLTEEWTEYTSNFADMKQEPYWGEPKASIDATALYQLQWQVNAADADFDIQVDDIKFIGCGTDAL